MRRLPTRRRVAPASAPGGRIESLETRVVPAQITVLNVDDSGAGSLRDAIERANRDADPDAIEFAPGVVGTIALATELPGLTTDLTLAGPGASALTVARSSAPGTPAFRVFTVAEGATVTISGLKITGGSAGKGGGLANAGTLSLSGVEVAGNAAELTGQAGAPGIGGGLYNSGTLAVANSRFLDNAARGQAGTGPTRGGLGSGGGIENEGAMTLRDSEFLRNIAGGGGYTAIFSGAGNDGVGGGLANRASATISGCTFAENLARGGDVTGGDGGLGRGGGLANFGTMTLTTSTFTGNLARGGPANRGGGIDNSGALTASSLALGLNRTEGYFGAFGGGVDNSGAMSLSDSILTQNTATGLRFRSFGASGNGGGIHNDGEMLLRNTLVDGNVSVGYTVKTLGGGVANAGTMTIESSTVRGNLATYSRELLEPSGQGLGGGIHSSGTLTLSASSLVANVAEGRVASDTGQRDPAGASGGGVYSTGTLAIRTSTFGENVARLGFGPGGAVASLGGALFVDGDSTITASTFARNEADLGGAIFQADLYVGPGDGPASILRLSNTILQADAGGTLGRIGGDFASQGFNLFSDTPGLTLDASDRAGIDPRLAPLGPYGGPTPTFALLPGSPAIDAGSAVPGLVADQRGVPRGGGRSTMPASPDIGAFESRGFSAQVVLGSGQSAELGARFATPIVVAASSAFGEPVAGGIVRLANAERAGLAGASATIDGDGRATFSATASGRVGTYEVAAGGPGFDGVGLVRLTNLASQNAPPTITSARSAVIRVRARPKARPRRVPAVLVTFDEAMDPASAGNRSSYSLTTRRGGHGGGSNTPRKVPIQSASYDPETRTATLFLAPKLARGRPLILAVAAGGGPVDPQGAPVNIAVEIRLR